MRWLPFVAVVPVLAFLLGLVFPGLPPEPPAVTRGGGGQRAEMLRPGETAAAATRFLRTLRSDPKPPPPPAPPPRPTPPPPPPPPDVAVVFKSLLAGVEQDADTGTLRALVRQSASPSPQIARMAVGDSFGDGWKLSEISETAVTLRKGKDVRVVRLYG
ncbi:MAG: hypothetical protein KF910_12025 [Brevundimonas sp.]|uniref:hypothetical protein n=1 Tax=Brevundimonas sp. TaxID=1871086 RepID=UPI0025C45D0C|nr:hypothetical protein [Brevundimonas sp.]MBX3478331.1 hypothetical protein [Brevundimonas sp.]